MQIDDFIRDYKDKVDEKTLKEMVREIFGMRLQEDTMRKKALNIKNLEIKKDKNYAEIIFFGDLHYGSNNCDIERARKMLDYCTENNIYVLFMGDLIEAATRYSIGSEVYEQLNPNQQINGIVDLLQPLADKGLIIGYLSGNHEDRVMKETGVDISSMICKMLKIPYLGAAGWNLIQVGKQNYTIYAIHGVAGSRFIHTKLKAAIDISSYFEADIIAHAHVHDIDVVSVERQKVDMRNKTIKYRKCHILVTGHYLKYENSYAQAKGLPPSKMGSPKVKLHSDKFDVHTSI